MKRLIFFVLLLTPSWVMGQGVQSGFVTLLGQDTLAVERFVNQGSLWEADVVLRSPQTSWNKYRLVLGENGNIVAMTVQAVPVSNPTAAVLSERIVGNGDSLQITVVRDGEPSTRSVAAPAGTLPFLDMIHWPFDLVLTRAKQSGGNALEQPLLSGSRVMSFGVGNEGNGNMTLTHPTRGTMTVKVDDLGRLNYLDAGATTRKLKVHRTETVDIESVAARWTALDEAGKSFGALSGRGATEAFVSGANLTADFGQPGKRGRDIWGKLVPFGEFWRTGANRATHITTDRDLVFGDFTLTAGEYTLFSIPEEDGGVLIINGQTGQNGTSYNAERDVIRLPMTRTAIGSPVEWFTVDFVETTDGGQLRLVWDSDAFVVPFSVR